MPSKTDSVPGKPRVMGTQENATYRHIFLSVILDLQERKSLTVIFDSWASKTV